MPTTRNLETVAAIVLMGRPFAGRPVHLALAPLTHAARVLCFPILAPAEQFHPNGALARARLALGGRAAPLATGAAAEAGQAVMKFPAAPGCAVIGLPDAKWGEQVTAVVQADAAVLWMVRRSGRL